MGALQMFYDDDDDDDVHVLSDNVASTLQGHFFTSSERCVARMVERAESIKCMTNSLSARHV